MITRVTLSRTAASLIAVVGMLGLLLGLLTFPLYAQEGELPHPTDEPAEAAPAAVDATPGLVPFPNVQSLSASTEGTCAITHASALFCWGNNSSGQNGTGDTNARSMPAAVASLSNVRQVSRGGAHTCAVTSQGAASCWGNNASGQLGDGTLNPRLTPTVVFTSGIAHVAAGAAFTCALRTNGTVACWGDNLYGQLGMGVTGGSALSPLPVSDITTAAALDAGDFHACALLASGEMRCWGNNNDGQIGNDSLVTQFSTSQKVLLPEEVVQITAGGTTSCARTALGKVYCWGNNVSGQVGAADAPADHRLPFASLSLDTNIAQVDTNGSSTCAVTTVGLVYCWGSNLNHQLGAGGGAGGAEKVSIVGLPTAVRSVSVGAFHVCAPLIDSRVVCWGNNQGNALGDGTNLSSVAPTYVRTSSTCFALTLARGGAGALPRLSPSNSNGCPLHHFTAGEQVMLTAIPDALTRVQGWSAPVAFSAGDTLALLSMPNADTTATVTYAACRLLTRTHTGNGGNPTPSFNNSGGCAAGRYAVGEVIQLAATPSANQRVQAWSGTAIAPGLGLPINSVVMPDADRTVNVAYEACNTLTIAATGQGDLPGVFPAASAGCPAGTFVAGEAIQFTAAPAQGWRVGGWSGTANDASTAATNTLTMPAESRAVAVTYVLQDVVVRLPIVVNQ